MSNLLLMPKQEILDNVFDISGSTVERVLASMLIDKQIEKYGSFKTLAIKENDGQ